MTTISLRDISKYESKEVEVKGWLFNMRSSGKIAFLQFRDGSDMIQVIAEKKKLGEEAWEKLNELTIESSVILRGEVSKHPKKEEYEIQLAELEVIHIAEEYPIAKKDHNPDFLLDNRHLWLRSKKQWAIMKIRDEVFFSITNFLRKQKFTRIDSPILQPTSCEDTSELFAIDYFDKGEVYLTQSGQLYLEAAAMSLGNVYDFGPVFRAEKSKTRKHLNEFWMMDAEMTFMNLEEMMDLIEKMIKQITTDVLENCKTELEVLERDVEPLKRVRDNGFIRMKHKEVIEMLNEKYDAKLTLLDDIGAPEEEMLSKEYDMPVFVTDWPAEIKTFYMPVFEDDGMKRVRAMDLIGIEGFGELAGGSEREWDHDKLIEVMKERDYKLEDYDWYLDLRKYGSIPHCGFGLGFERTIGWLAGVKHVRETIPFPRTINRITP